MNRTVLSFGLAALCGLALVPAVPARRVLMVPYAFHVATTDAVVVGTVTAITDKAEKAELSKGDEREMKIATVKVESSLLGKGGATVKVGFLVPPRARPGKPAARQYSTVNLTRGQEACLFLTNHPTRKGVLILASSSDVVDKTWGDDWKKQYLPEVKKYARLLAAPMKSLQSKDAEERLLTAALLIERYKTPTDSKKTEPVGAPETKLLLTALAEADWNKVSPRNYKLNAQALFFKLGATEKDGWKTPKEYTKIAPAAKKWLKDNAGKFKMTRYARERVSTEVSEEPGK
jgi:hypothetical protein